MPYNDRVTLGVDIQDDVLANIGNSPEESIMAHTVQGGAGDILYPVDPNENKRKYFTFFELKSRNMKD
jgi:hypothetical protein